MFHIHVLSHSYFVILVLTFYLFLWLLLLGFYELHAYAAHINPLILSTCTTYSCVDYRTHNYPFCYKIKETLGTKGRDVIDDVFCALLSKHTLFNSSIMCNNSLLYVELKFK